MSGGKEGSRGGVSVQGRGLHRVELMGPDVRTGIEEPRAALQPGRGPRASPPQASTTGTASTTGAAAPSVPPACRGLVGTSKIVWPQSGREAEKPEWATQNRQVGAGC
ncbi:unnamed protein product [Rangifer tarandus platyrhynchus]|uniref:Uncharacterized protein n=2 Tax=Rangifer tarandus platyrhynchus TaxID=3082113 RepID=A0ACB0F285_RANTA|nr:unnamed protein product [Rangifer tarandus platyrhynchus]CAI9706782.1 unnamed protein product [Rangifer tarandus platyrhynchus]